MDSILLLFQLLINVQFCKKEKIKSLNRQFREIKFRANTIFLRNREIKDSRKLSPAKIKENKVCALLIIHASTLDDLTWESWKPPNQSVL